MLCRRSAVNIVIIGILFVAGTSALVISYGTCTTAYHTLGHCVALSDCPQLLKLAVSLTDNSTSNFDKYNSVIILRDSHCGFDSNETQGVHKTRVCCPYELPPDDSEKELSQSVRPLRPGNELPGSNECGITLGTRILGGVDTQIDEYPWSALIKYQRPYNATALSCAGVLINSRYVLSAAHCVKNPSIPLSWKIDSVRLGEWDISMDPDCFSRHEGSYCAPPHVEIKIERIIVHDQYIPHSQSEFHDIALVRMVEPVAYSDTIRPICLPLEKDMIERSFEGDVADVAGWGQTEVRSYSTTKRKISLRIWPTAECEQRFMTINIPVNHNTQLCAGGVRMQDTCQGDSGAPLTIQGSGVNSQYYVIGVVSFGMQPCGMESWPGIYTRVTHYVDWIQRNLEY